MVGTTKTKCSKGSRKKPWIIQCCCLQILNPTGNHIYIYIYTHHIYIYTHTYSTYRQIRSHIASITIFSFYTMVHLYTSNGNQQTKINYKSLILIPIKYVLLIFIFKLSSIFTLFNFFFWAIPQGHSKNWYAQTQNTIFFFFFARCRLFVWISNTDSDHIVFNYIQFSFS